MRSSTGVSSLQRGQLWICVVATVLVAASPQVVFSIHLSAFVIIGVFVIAPLAYVVLMLRVYRLSNRNRHTWWLLLLAPICLWQALQMVVVVLIWSLRGGIV